MYAIVKTGGKQYRVEKGATLFVEKIDAETGAKIDLADVLMVGDEKTTKVGTPLVSGATVKAEVVGQLKDVKIIIFKKKRRQNYRRKNGHRQRLTEIKITDIKA